MKSSISEKSASPKPEGLEPVYTISEKVSNGCKAYLEEAPTRDPEDNNNVDTQKKRGFRLRQKLILVLLASVDFICFASVAILAPFYPREAHSKGVSESLSGFVFSFPALIMFLTSPLMGKLVPRFGEKFLYNSGLVIGGICRIAFGFLKFVDDYYWFTFLSLFTRGMEAIGASAYTTASFVFASNLFPNNVGAVRGTLETFVGLGLSAGPAIGGLLYSVGGFELPFYVMGGITLATLPFSLTVLPARTSSGAVDRKESILKMIKIPSVLIMCAIIVVVSMTWSFLDPTLEPHLRQFNLDPTKIGLIFLLLAGVYGISSPCWGWCSDKLDSHWSMMAIGLFFNTLGLLTLGPAPFFAFLDSSLGLTIGSLCCIGLSTSLALLPTFNGLLMHSIAAGFEDSLSTQGLVAGLWAAMYSLGEVIGPTTGGFLLQYYGFPTGSTTIAACNFGLFALCIVYFNKNKIGNRCRPVQIESGVHGVWRKRMI